MAQAIKPRAGSGTLTGTRLLIVIISTVTGVCFAVLAGLSISDILAPVRQRHVLSVVIAVVAIAFAFLAIRAARAGYTDRVTLVESLFRGLIGAFAGFLVGGGYVFLFRPDAEDLVAHSLGLRASALTVFQLLMASVVLGFGAGFVARMRIARK